MKSIYKRLGWNKVVMITLKELEREFWFEPTRDILNTSDIEKMRDDWEKVGGDLRWSMENFQKTKYKMTK